MAATVSLVDPKSLKANPGNPRLIFRQDEMEALERSIKAQGILVPLTVYQSGKRGALTILDGERRWRCAIRLGMRKVPVILQPRPDPLTNLMMMFAIHHRRQDWDPLPTALKLKELEEMFFAQNERNPTEAELAELASLTRGEVRRFRKLLGLPDHYKKTLLLELDKPRSQQTLTVDHVLESFAAASIFRRRGLVNAEEERQLRDSLVDKFRSGVIDNTVAPRKLAKISLAVSRGQLPEAQARNVISRVIRLRNYSVDQAVEDSIANVENENAIRSFSERLISALETVLESRQHISSDLRSVLRRVAVTIEKLT